MNKIYYRIAVILLFLRVSSPLFSQNVGINTTGATPSANAILDLNSGNSHNLGLIIPHVELGAALTTFGMAYAATTLDTAMLVYNMNSTNHPLGLYYWGGVGTGWVSLAGGGGGTVTAANDGTSLNGTTVILGGAFNSTLGQLTQNTEIPFNGHNLTFSNVGGGGTMGIDIAANTSAAQALEIGQATNTIRINGLKAGNTFNIANGSAAATSYLMFANTNGDLNSMAAGANGNSLIWTASGPTWGAPTTSATAWQILGNGNITPSTAAIGSAVTAGSNFLGTTTEEDLVFALNNGTNTLERMRIQASTGNVGINTINPGAQFDVEGVNTTTGNIVTINGSALTTGTALNVTSNTTGAVGNGIANFNFTGTHTGNGINVTDVTTGGTAMALNANSITTAAGNGLVINMNGITSGTGNALLVSSTSAYTGANGLFAITGNATTGVLAKITGNSLSTGTGLSINSTSAYTGANGLFAITGSATTGTLENITGNSLSTGTGLSINSTSAYTGANGLFAITGNATTGVLAKITGNSLSTGTGLSINSTSAYTGANGLFAITGSATTGTLENITGNSLTTGTAENISSTSTAGTANNSSYLLNLSRSGANTNTNHTAYGISSSVTNTNATSGTNIAGYFTASGATTGNYALLVPSGGGSVGIGTIAPAQLLEIGGTTNTIRVDGLQAGNTFNIANGSALTTSYLMFANTNGDLNAMAAGANNTALIWTATGPIWGGNSTSITGGPIGSVLSNSAANTPAWNASPAAAGQLLLSNNLGVPTWLTTPANGILYSNAGTPAWSLLGGLPATAGILPIANGGTNTNATPTAGGVAYGTGTAYAFSAAGASGDFLMSNGTNPPTWASVTGSFTTVSAQNGLSWVNPTVELGGSLIQNTLITLSGYNLDITDNTAGNAIISLNDQATGANDAVNIGSTASVIGINEYGNIGLNVNNAAFTTNIGTGTTTGNVLIGGASNRVGINEAAPVSTLDDNGSFGTGTTDISPAALSTTPLTNAYSTVIATPPALGSAYTLSLPSATANPRQMYTIVYNGNGLGTIDVTSPIAGNIMSSGVAITPLVIAGGSAVLQSDGTNWIIVSSSGGALGSQIITVEGTGTVNTNVATPAWVNVPGLTSTFTISSPMDVVMNMTCGVANNTGAGNNCSNVQFDVLIDGNPFFFTQGMVCNTATTATYYSTSGTWGQLLAAGTHTFTIEIYPINGKCTVGGNNTSVLMPVMCITLLQ
jgi:hypothetical protein